MSRRILYMIAVGIVLLDQTTKFWVAHSLSGQFSVQLIPDFLFFTRTSNTGSAFGLFPTATTILAVAAFVAATAIIVYSWRHARSLPFKLALGLALPLGGAIGNFLDRARLHYVVDFIDMRFGSFFFPVFNIADMAICIGVALLAFNYIQVSNHPLSEQSTVVSE